MIKSSYLRAKIMIRVLEVYKKFNADFSKLSNEQKEYVLDMAYKHVYNTAVREGISINVAIKKVFNH